MADTREDGKIAMFIKTERLCCDFFSFDLIISDNNLSLSITGPEGAQEFIKTEMDF